MKKLFYLWVLIPLFSCTDSVTFDHPFSGEAVTLSCDSTDEYFGELIDSLLKNNTGFTGLNDITFQQCGYLGLDFLSENSRFNDASGLSYGGFINGQTIRTMLNQPGADDGIKFYACYNQNETDNSKKLFIVYKRVNSYSQGLGNNPRELRQSSFPITYPSSQPSSVTDVKDFLKMSYTADAIPANNDITSAGTDDIQAYCQAFMHRYKDGNGNDLNKEPFGFVSHFEILRHLNNADGLFYFYGVDETAAVNKIRLYFIPASYDQQQHMLVPIIMNGNEYRLMLERLMP